MKNKTLLYLALIALILCLAWGPVVAQAPQPGESQPGYWLFLPLPPAGSLDVPAGLNRSQVQGYIATLAREQARPVLASLESLRARGLIAAYALQPEQYAVAVYGAGPAATSDLQRVAQPGALAPAAEAAACSQTYLQVLDEQVRGLSRARLAGPQAPDEPLVTDPRIWVRFDQGSTWNYISGRTTANTQTTLRILRNAQVLATQTTTSAGDGYFYFYPNWTGGCAGRYNWVLRGGDVVEVSAHGSVVSTVVANITGWVDPASNIVAGQTDPGRSVNTRLFAGNNLCSLTTFTQKTGSDNSGQFAVNFSSQTDFDRRAWVQIEAADVNDNYTYTYFDAYHLYWELPGSEIHGALRPDIPFNATLQRGASIVATLTGRTAKDGWFYGAFSQAILPGDVILVSGSGINISYTAAALTTTQNPATNQVSGSTAASRRVRAEFSKQSSAYWRVAPTGCGYGGSECASGSANGSGAFAFTSSLDLQRGDFVDLTVFDGEGNYQYAERAFPLVIADAIFNEVWGAWGKQGGEVSVALKDSSNALKQTRANIPVAEGDRGFHAYFTVDLVPGDKIEVSDGVTTEIMTVQSLNAALNNTSERVTGSAAAGRLISLLADYRPGEDEFQAGCWERNHGGGNFEADFSSLQVGAKDQADVFLAGPDGHFTYRASHAFEIGVQPQAGLVGGYTALPEVALTVRVWNGANLVQEKTAISDVDGWYLVPMSGDIPTGYRVEVLADQSASLTLPALSVTADSANNRLVGKSPANQSIWAGIEWDYLCTTSYICSGGLSLLSRTDAAGNFSIPFAGEVVWKGEVCSPAQVGGACIRPYLEYYFPSEHHVMVFGAQPPAVGPDAFESDDTPGSAPLYTGPGAHTFHAAGDVDWVRFTVSAGQAGKPLFLHTYRLGPTQNTVLELYAGDGSTLLASDDNSGGKWESLLIWTPTAAGTYYARLSPYNPNVNAQNCGASYEFMIASSRLYLPVARR